MPVLRTCDVFAPGLALGHAFGRVGCFAAGCCYGSETHVPWAVTFHNPLAKEIVGTPLNVPLHPTQLYEMILELCNCLFLVWLIRRKKFEGEIIGTYMIIYGMGRYFIEFFRGDPGRGQVPGLHVRDAGDRVMPGDRRRPAVDAAGRAGSAGAGQSGKIVSSLKTSFKFRVSSSKLVRK